MSTAEASRSRLRFDTVLIANRGEIAERVKRACLALGVRPVAIASEADAAEAPALEEGGPLCVGPATAAKSYLNQAAVLLAARVSGAGAVHPGYGFLSENADFAEALEKAGWKVGDLDLVEANEAFAAQACAVNKGMGWDPAKVNVNGGAIAIGHPIGASGARILNTLLFEMKRSGAKKGLATLCIGGGMGVAMCVER